MKGNLKDEVLILFAFEDYILHRMLNWFILIQLKLSKLSQMFSYTILKYSPLNTSKECLVYMIITPFIW